MTAAVSGDTAVSVAGGDAAAVCVIGAGAAGLAAGRLLRDEGLRVTILEKSQHLGGVWRYHAGPGEEKAPMYRSLVTNLPKETMSFFGLAFPADFQSFTTHGQVLDYLCSYADEYDLHPMVRLGCSVETVRPVAVQEDGQGMATADVERERAVGKWEVVYRRDSDVGDGDGGDARRAAAAASPVTELFDAVCVCNGHFDQPFTPRAEGLDGFRGTSIHARQYDTPGVEAFIGKRVLCVGSRSSGTDVAREVSSVAAVVHVADRKNLETLTGGGEKGNVRWRPAVERFEGENGVRFKGGELEEVDTVVWCTGYDYSFPFLEGSGLLTPPASARVHPLYEQLFHVRHPSLSFIGLQQSVVPFPLFEVQANAVAAAISGRASLPRLAEREQWLLDEEEDLRERSVDPATRGAHVLGGRQWPYLRRLLRMAAGPGFVARRPARGSAAGAAAAGEGTVEGSPEAALEALLKTLSIKEAIYNDASDNRPPFPGGADDYRRRVYRVDWETGAFSTSYAARKANGEGPPAI